MRVSRYSGCLAETLGADSLVAKAGGLLHDIGAAKFGRDEHHLTGVAEAALVLLKVNCPLKFIGPILHCVYSHRGSAGIVSQTPEAKCVAAADTLDHFINLEELYRSQVDNLGIMEMEAYQFVRNKLKRDWEKTTPEIRAMLEGTYEKALEELVKIASQRKMKIRS